MFSIEEFFLFIKEIFWWKYALCLFRFTARTVLAWKKKKGFRGLSKLIIQQSLQSKTVYHHARDVFQFLITCDSFLDLWRR